MKKTIEEIKKELTAIMVDLRSVEFNSSFAKAASHLDYALKELKTTTSKEDVSSTSESRKETITEALKNTAEANEDETVNVPAGDDYEISQAGGANPADDANFGLQPAK